ncbi:MAG: response regulator [Leptospirales bacterium]|nr:response regulator [Leptospirales bacterium]
MGNHSSPLAEILLVEDSPSDAMMTQEALFENNVINHVNTVNDGTEALLFLRRQGAYAAVVRPGLILLDLNLPRKNGLELLEEIKQDPDLKTIPVIVLTTSRAREDIDRSYALHANSYIPKPVEFAEFAEAMRVMKEFWFKIVALPTEEV